MYVGNNKIFKVFLEFFFSRDILKASHMLSLKPQHFHQIATEVVFGSMAIKLFLEIYKCMFYILNLFGAGSPTN